VAAVPLVRRGAGRRALVADGGLGLAWIVGTYAWVMDVLKWVAVGVFAGMMGLAPDPPRGQDDLADSR
jgi:hypothetical protein